MKAKCMTDCQNDTAPVSSKDAMACVNSNTTCNGYIECVSEKFGGTTEDGTTEGGTTEGGSTEGGSSEGGSTEGSTTELSDYFGQEVHSCTGSACPYGTCDMFGKSEISGTDGKCEDFYPEGKLDADSVCGAKDGRYCLVLSHGMTDVGPVPVDDKGYFLVTCAGGSQTGTTECSTGCMSSNDEDPTCAE